MALLVTSLLTLLVTWAHTSSSSSSSKQTLVYSWVKVQYDWPNDTMEQQYISDGKYIVSNNVITGIKVYKDEVYLTVPRWRPGVPATLNRVVNKNDSSSSSSSNNSSSSSSSAVLLQPFPSWQLQTEGNCEALQYVQSMEVDPNTGLMWIIDNGRTNFFSTTGPPANLCPPKLVIYDLEKKRQVHSYTFPPSVANYTSCFLNDIVLHYVSGDVKYAYVTDTSDAKLYVYDVDKDSSYLFQHPSMQAEKPGGVPVDGIAMSADFQFLYYSPIDGHGLFQIPTSVLTDPNASFGKHVRRVGTRRSRSDGLAYGQNSLFYGLLDLSGVQRWLVAADAKIPGYGDVNMTSQEELVRDDVRMRWVDTFGWDGKGNLWFTANDLSKYFAGSMDFSGASGPNMYVWKVFVHESSYLSKGVAGPSSGTGHLWAAVWVAWLAVVHVTLMMSPTWS